MTTECHVVVETSNERNQSTAFAPLSLVRPAVRPAAGSAAAVTLSGREAKRADRAQSAVHSDE